VEFFQGVIRIRPTAENREIRIGLLADTHLTRRGMTHPFGFCATRFSPRRTMGVARRDGRDLGLVGNKYAFPDIPRWAVRQLRSAGHPRRRRDGL
jgi:hypothetical protein